MRTGTPLPASATPRTSRRMAGFTMTEILITVAIAAVLAGVAIPNLGSFMNKIKLNSISSSLVASLQLGRSEAIKMNRPVLVCRKNTAGTGCSSATADWGERGWFVCYAQFSADVCETSTTALPNPIRSEAAIDPNFATVIGTVNRIRFGPTGSQGTSTETITITPTAGGTALTITIAPSGLIKGSRL